MAEQNEGEGTEDPTDRRRRQAREEGQVVQSPEVASAFALLASGLILMWFGSAIGEELKDAIRMWLSDSVSVWSPQMDGVVFHWLTYRTLAICSIPIAIILTVTFAIAFVQTGPMFMLTPITIKFEKLSPATNWKRLMSLDNGLKSLLALLKVHIAFIATSIFVYWNWRLYGTSTMASLGSISEEAWDAGVMIWLVLAGVFLTPAALDYLFKKYQHEQKLKMTHQEIKREQKDDNGDPQIKMRQRQRQREMIKQRSVANVPDATVILTNPTHLAIALKYKAGMSAPVVVAKGAGVFAKNIVRIAKGHRIPVLERKPLARAIYKNIKVGQEIPPEFFKAVAEVLGHIYKLRKTTL